MKRVYLVLFAVFLSLFPFSVYGDEVAKVEFGSEDEVVLASTANALPVFAAVGPSLAEEQNRAVQAAAVAASNSLPYRTFVILESFANDKIESTANLPAETRVEVSFPNGTKTAFPAENEFWKIAVGEKQEINRTFEIPLRYIHGEKFEIRVQMIIPGQEVDPCLITVQNVPQFNREYVCKTDVPEQLKSKHSFNKLVNQKLRLRVVTDVNSEATRLPEGAVALK